MLRLAFATMLLLAAAPSLHACWNYVPLETFVDRAEYVLRLKVVEIEENTEDPVKDEHGNWQYKPDYAVCEVKEILMGLVTGDGRGRIRLSFIVRRHPTEDGGYLRKSRSTDVSYRAGTEFTFIGYGAQFVEGLGTVINGMGHPDKRQPAKPPKRLRKLVQARMDRAYALLDKFDNLIPNARGEAEAAVIEHEAGERTDYKDLSPEADLLLDLVATNRGAPAEAKAPRRDLDAATRERLRLLTLRVVCELPKDAARTALRLLGGDGHGPGELLAPADISLEDAMVALEELDEQGHLAAVLPAIVGQDIEHRALGWSARLILKGGYTGKLAEWLWISHIAAEKYRERRAVKLLTGFLGAKEKRSYLHQTPQERMIARLIDAEAWALLTVLELTGFEDMRGVGESGAEDGKLADERRVKAYRALHEQPAYLAVYTFVKAVADEKTDGLKDMRKRIEQQQRYKGDNEVDLDDLAALEWRVRREYGSLPRAIELAIRNAED